MFIWKDTIKHSAIKHPRRKKKHQCAREREHTTRPEWSSGDTDSSTTSLDNATGTSGMNGWLFAWCEQLTCASVRYSGTSWNNRRLNQMRERWRRSRNNGETTMRHWRFSEHGAIEQISSGESLFAWGKLSLFDRSQIVAFRRAGSIRPMYMWLFQWTSTWQR